MGNTRKSLMFGYREWGRFKSYAAEKCLTIQEALEKVIRKFLSSELEFQSFLEANEDRLHETARRSVLVDPSLYDQYIEAADRIGGGRNRLALVPILLEWFLSQEEAEEKKS